MNCHKGVDIIKEADNGSSISFIPEHLQANIVYEILQDQKPKLQVDCQSFAQTYKDLDTLHNFKTEE